MRGQRGVHSALVADGDSVCPRPVPTWLLAQKLPKPCVGCSDVSYRQRPEAPRREPLGAREGQSVSVGSTRSVRPTVPKSRLPPLNSAPGRSVPRSGVGRQVGDVQGRVARGRDHAQVDVAEGQRLVVVHADAGELDLLVGGHQVLRPVTLREGTRPPDT